MFARPDTKNGRTPRAGAGNRARLLFVALGLLLLGAPLAWAHDVKVRIDSQPRSCRVEGDFKAPVPAAVAWRVLTDYDHIAEFVHSMVSSRSERDSSGALHVHQVASGGIFVFRRKVNVTLAITEVPGERIEFRDVLGKDFWHYHGQWRLEPDSAGVHVHYELEAEPRMSVPRSIYRGMLKDAAGDLLNEVRGEMLKRAANYPDPAPGRR
ncbi:MAG: SRPBCC family protein [Candidatus Eisenbacteria bacterium]|nr:SRPBCC family protein [Candidatus Eisenbacteria bacterium]